MLNPSFGTDETSGQAYLSDATIEFMFTMIKNQYGNVDKVYGVEVPVWPDLQNSNTAPTVTVDGVAYNQCGPWRQTQVTEPETFIRFLRDRVGLNFPWHEEGITDPAAEVDDAETHPLFMDWRVNYIKDQYGNPLPTALEGSSAFEDGGTADVGVMCMGYWRKVVRTVNSVDYDAERYATLFAQFGGVPVEQRFYSLNPPAGEDGWVWCSAATRHDGSHAPYCIRSPFLNGLAADGKYRQQSGLLAVQNMSYNTLHNAYNVQTSARYKGPGYHGGSIEVHAFASEMLLLMHGVKSSQALATGVTSWQNRFAAEGRDEAGRTFPLSTADASVLDVGQYVAVRMQGQMSNYAVTTGYSADTRGQCDYGAEQYQDGVQSVRILAKVPRNDGSGIVDVELDVADGFTVPRVEYERPAFVNVSGGLLGPIFYTSQAAQLAYVVNPNYDSANGNGADSKYTPANNANASTVRGYITNGTNNINLYAYIPQIETYTGVSRAYLQQGYPRAGVTNAIYRHRNGCLGRSRTNMSPLRIRMLEFGQGLYDVVSDMVITSETIDGATVNVVRMAGKGRTRYTSFAYLTDTYADVGRKMGWSGWPSEFVFTNHGDTNFGTEEEPLYLPDGFFPDGEAAYKGCGADSISWGDYHYAANTANSSYEVLVGGDAGNGGGAGLLYLSCFFGLGNSFWYIAARD